MVLSTEERKEDFVAFFCDKNLSVRIVKPFSIAVERKLLIVTAKLIN